MSLAQVRKPSPVRVVFDGQSMNESPPYPNNSPKWAMLGTNIPWIEVGIGGNGWQDLTPTINTRLKPQARNRAGCLDILVMNGGQGDRLNSPGTGGTTAETCYQRALDYAAAARALGFHKIITVTWPQWGDILFGGDRATVEDLAVKDAYNQMVLDNAEDWDAVVDCHTPAPFTNAADTTYFAIDQLHLNPLGASIMGELIREKIEELI